MIQKRLLIALLLLTVVGISIYLFVSAPKTTAPTPSMAESKNLVPSDASRSQNYTLVPLKQDLQVAPATTSTPTSTSATTTP